MRAYRARNKERLVANERAWCKANRKRVAASKRAWRKRNPGAALAIRARWRAKNREAIRVYMRAYMSLWNRLNGHRITSYRLKRLGPGDSLFKAFLPMCGGFESYYAIEWRTPADILMEKEAA